jgi:hypothetical protein
MTPGGWLAPAPTLGLGGLSASVQQLYCQLAGGIGNLTLDSTLNLRNFGFPLKGQELFMPVGVAVVASFPYNGSADFLAQVNAPIHFPPSNSAVSCLPDMYRSVGLCAALMLVRMCMCAICMYTVFWFSVYMRSMYVHDFILLVGACAVVLFTLL